MEKKSHHSALHTYHLLYITDKDLSLLILKSGNIGKPRVEKPEGMLTLSYFYYPVSKKKKKHWLNVGKAQGSRKLSISSQQSCFLQRSPNCQVVLRKG